MQHRIFFLPAIIATLLAPSCLQADAIDQLLYHGIMYTISYPSRLRMRQNMPESKQDYFKRVKIGLEGLDTHLKKTIKDDYDWSVTGPMMRDLQWEINAKWKQSWWDNNPGLGDLILTASIVTVIGIIVACVRGSNNPGAPGAANLGVPAVDPGAPAVDNIPAEA